MFLARFFLCSESVPKFNSFSQAIKKNMFSAEYSPIENRVNASNCAAVHFS